MDGAAGNTLRHNCDVAAIATRRAMTGAAPKASIASITAIARSVARIGRGPTWAALASVAAVPTGTAITAFAAASVDIHSNNKIVYLDGDVAAELAS
jgi:hypothetical protein